MSRAGKASGAPAAAPPPPVPVRRSGTPGFTLFELIIVLMIVAVSAAFTVPAITSGWQAREIRQGTRQVAALMRRMRERAVRRGVDQEVVLESDGATMHWTDGGEGTLPEGAGIVAVRGGWRDIDGNVRVQFYPSGGSNGVAVIVAGRRGDGLQFAIEVEPLLGSVTISEVTG